MAFDVILFYLFGSLSLTAGTMVISARNPIHSVLFLVLVFCNVSCLLILLEVEFLALIFIIVYVGAIAVLFLFVVMMLNVKLSELNDSLLHYLPVGGLLACIFLCEIGLIISNDLVPTIFYSGTQDGFFDIQYFCSCLAPWGFLVEGATNIELFGQIIYTDYLYLFLVAGMILLVSMIGAIVLTLHKRINVHKQDIFKQVSTNFEKVVHNYS